VTGYDFEALTKDWLEDEPRRMPERALEATLAEIHRTAQVKSTRLIARPFHDNLLLLGIAAVMATIVIGLTVAVLGRLPTNLPPAQLPPDELNVSSPSPAVSSLAPVGYPGAGTIAFVRNDPSVGGDATWITSPNGTGEAPFRDGSGFYKDDAGTGCCAVFSPDGTQIAIGYDFLNPSWANGKWTSATVQGLDGSSISSLPVFCGGCGSIENVNYVPRAWSPDSRWVAMEVWSDSDQSMDGIRLAPTCGHCSEIYSGASMGTACAIPGCDWTDVETGANRDVPIAFSPDSKYLLFVRLTSEDAGSLNMLEIANKAVKQLTPDGMLVYANGYFGPSASWSEDGSQVAFAGTDINGSTALMSVYIVPREGVVRLTQIAGPTPFLTSAKWSPDGSWIAYDRTSYAGPSGFHDIYLIHPDGSGQTDLTVSFDPGMCCARWSPDSTALLAAGTTSSDDQSNLFIVPIDGSKIYQVTNTPALYTDFSWGPASR